MAESKLILHSGAKPVTLEELQAYEAPPPEGRWRPLSHSYVLSVVTQMLTEAGYSIVKQQLAVMKDRGSQFFGTLDLASPITEGISLAVGIRNSVNKTLPLGFCAGSRVFCCDNLAFRSELLVQRKHTLHGERDFKQRIFEAVASLDSFRDQEAARTKVLAQTELDDNLADALMLRAFERGIVGTRDLPKVLDQWRNPREEFRPRTAWSLLNAFTSGMKERASFQPQDYSVQSIRLHALLSPSDN